jgi:hypothetical protein
MLDPAGSLGPRTMVAALPRFATDLELARKPACIDIRRYRRQTGAHISKKFDPGRHRDGEAPATG